jgi:beta-galactosidase
MKKLSVYLAGVLTLLVFALSVNAQEYDYISKERKTPYWRDVNVVKAHKEYP